MRKNLIGLMTSEACEVLRELAGGVPREQAIVEVGSFKGQSTCWLAWGSQEGNGARVFAVDPWDLPGNENGVHGYAQHETREAFHQQIREAGVESVVSAIQGFSTAVAKGWWGPRIGMLYIDGDHSKKAVLSDFAAWRPHLAPGATVAFDDWGTRRNPGVAGAVRRLRLSDQLRVLGIRGGRIAVCRLP